MEFNGDQLCECRDGVICDSCAATQIAQSQRTSDNPTLTTEQVDALTTEAENWLLTLKPQEKSA